MNPTKRVCKNGHQYYKSTDCPTCPVCEAHRKPDSGFLSLLSAPARRAMENAGIESVLTLSQWTENDVRKLHGMGPSSIPKLMNALQSNGLHFKKGKA